jgi:hypothetical protein
LPVTDHLQPAWKPGQSGNPGGRPKKLITRVDEILHGLKLNPTTELIALIPQLKPREQAEIWMELLSYCQAKPKQIEIVVDPDVTSTLTDSELAEKILSATPMLQAMARGA